MMNEGSNSETKATENVTEEQFCIEKICGTRLSDNGKQQEYEVKWEGYGVEENTWETRDHLLENFPNELKAYEEEQANGMKKRVSTGNTNSRPPAKEKDTPMPSTSSQQRPAKNKRKIHVKKSKPHFCKVPKSIPNFNRKPKLAQSDKSKVKKKVNTSLPSPLRGLGAEAQGFDRGLEPEEVLTMTLISGQVWFLMKWKNSLDADFVRSKDANVKCPQVVIAFYEKHAGFEDPTPKI